MLFSHSDVTVQDLLRAQKTKMLPVDKSRYQRMVIRRKHVWDDALRFFRSNGMIWANT